MILQTAYLKEVKLQKKKRELVAEHVVPTMVRTW